MKRLCLDTTAYSFFRREHPEAVRLIRSATEVLVPVIAVGELRSGFRIGRMEAENEAKLAAFLREPVVRLLEVDDEATHRYADLFADLRQIGKPIPTNDLWIAALALREGAVVLTFDQHFRSIPRVGTHVLAS